MNFSLGLCEESNGSGDATVKDFTFNTGYSMEEAVAETEEVVTLIESATKAAAEEARLQFEKRRLQCDCELEKARMERMEQK